MTLFGYCNTAALLLCASTAFAESSEQDYAAAKAQLGAAYKADSKVCANLKGNAHQVCLEQAKGKANVARALAEYNHSGKAADAAKLAVAEAEAAFAIATEYCDEKTGDARNACRNEAKQRYDKALAESKTTALVAVVVKGAEQEQHDADYATAKAKCHDLAEPAQVACLNDAKATFGAK